MTEIQSFGQDAKDVKHASSHDVEAVNASHPSSDIEEGTTESSATRLQNRFTILRRLHEGETWLERKLGGEGIVETQGIDRIAEHEKKPPSELNIFLLWTSVTLHMALVSIGVLGPQFYLTFKQAASAAVVGNFTGALFPAFTGLLGPKLGLRQIVASRYAFGFWGAKLCAVLNMIVNGGFAVVNLVVVGQILSAVSDYTISIAVGSIIIAILGYVLSFFGFRLIHAVERYLWILSLILMIVVLAQSSKYATLGIPPTETGLAGAGTWLSYMSINFSNGSGWCSIAADYYVNYPATISKKKVFLMTWLGIAIPQTFGCLVGITLGQAAVIAQYPPFATALQDHGFGGLLLAAYTPIGWSKTALVFSSFTVVGNNIAINYSSGLSLQTLGSWFHAIPRFIWSFLFALVVVILAIAGGEHLSEILSDFVSLLGYWAVSFTLILLIEDQWIRRKMGYDLTLWDNMKKLPVGAAATFTLCAAYCAGGVPGMSQTWYVGPIAAKFGPYGGDVGIYMSGAITLLLYPILRRLELRYFKR